jgi:hypothetical protein
VRYPCEAGHYHAKGYSAGEADSGNVGRAGLLISSSFFLLFAFSFFLQNSLRTDSGTEFRGSFCFLFVIPFPAFTQSSAFQLDS